MIYQCVIYGSDSGASYSCFWPPCFDDIALARRNRKAQLPMANDARVEFEAQWRATEFPKPYANAWENETVGCRTFKKLNYLQQNTFELKHGLFDYVKREESHNLAWFIALLESFEKIHPVYLGTKLNLRKDVLTWYWDEVVLDLGATWTQTYSVSLLL